MADVREAYTDHPGTDHRGAGQSFSERVDSAGGPEGLEALATEGHAAHRVSLELQQIARSNTPERLRKAARSDRWYRLDIALLLVVVALGLVWIADNAVGYANSVKQPRVVSSAGIAHQTVQLHGGKVAGADCWAAGGIETVWKAAPPFGSVVPYRCGDSALEVAFPGVMSAGAAVLAVLGAFLIALAWRRRQRQAWY